MMNAYTPTLTGFSNADENAKQKDNGFQSMVNEQLFKARKIMLFGDMNPVLSERISSQLIALAEASNDPITIYINSPGGHVESGDSIHDLIRCLGPQVNVVGTGYVASIATHIYLAAEKENRYSLPNARYLIHQPLGGSRGQATDIEIQTRQILETKSRINKIIAERTGQSLEKVQKDTDRDFWMSPEEAIEYGVVGKVINSVADIK